MSIEDDIEFFERVPTLALLGREALRILAIGAESRYLEGGDVLCRQGDAVDAGYVVQEGSFRLTRVGESDATGRTAAAGAIIAEIALLLDCQAAFTAIARQPSTVIRIPRTLFVRMLEGYPEAAARLRDSLLAQTEQTAREMRTMRGKLGGGSNQTDQADQD
jgi:CRP-like cAMP-binding protein